MAQLRAQVAGYAEQTDRALAILGATDLRQMSLTAGTGTGASGARAFWSPTRGLLVVVDRLPAPPVNRVYQVWVIAGATPVSAGLLATPAAGPRMLIAPPPREGLAEGVTIAITDEPAGGLRAPSGTIHLSGAL
jgi:anti-sigma-K factor RskA